MNRELEKELALDDVLAVESSRVSIRVETRRYGKHMTILEGFDPAVDVRGLGKELKHKLGTGGTVRDGVIELQGEHGPEARALLEKKGFGIA